MSCGNPGGGERPVVLLGGIGGNRLGKIWLLCTSSHSLSP